MNHQQQKAFFETFGYLHLPGLLHDRAPAISAAFDKVWTEVTHINKTFHDAPSYVPFLDHSEYLCSLLDDPVLEGVIGNLIGSDFNYLGSDGNLYKGETGWHSDGRTIESDASKGCVFLKVSFYLDPLTAESGCLRVIPGSHRHDTAYVEALLKGLGNSKEVWGLDGAGIPAVALETTPGDVVIFNHNTLHASFKGERVRRMFTMNCGRRLTEELLPLLKAYCTPNVVTKLYGERILNSQNPRHRIHLEQVLDKSGMPYSVG